MQEMNIVAKFGSNLIGNTEFEYSFDYLFLDYCIGRYDFADALHRCQPTETESTVMAFPFFTHGSVHQQPMAHGPKSNEKPPAIRPLWSFSVSRCGMSDAGVDDDPLGFNLLAAHDFTRRASTASR